MQVFGVTLSWGRSYSGDGAGTWSRCWGVGGGGLLLNFYIFHMYTSYPPYVKLNN